MGTVSINSVQELLDVSLQACTHPPLCDPVVNLCKHEPHNNLSLHTSVDNRELTKQG